MPTSLLSFSTRTIRRSSKREGQRENKKWGPPCHTHSHLIKEPGTTVSHPHTHTHTHIHTHTDDCALRRVCWASGNGSILLCTVHSLLCRYMDHCEPPATYCIFVEPPVPLLEAKYICCGKQGTFPKASGNNCMFLTFVSLRLKSGVWIEDKGPGGMGTSCWSWKPREPRLNFLETLCEGHMKRGGAEELCEVNAITRHSWEMQS